MTNRDKWHIQSTSNESICTQTFSNSMQGIKNAKLAISYLDTYLAFLPLFPSVFISY
jgi:hypothetical protein